MKRFLSFVFVASLLSAGSVLAQTGTGFIGNGYYRIRNYATDRYIYVTDNKDYYDMARDKEDFQAIQLWKDVTRFASDPGSVIYFEEVTPDHFDLRAQGTGVHSFTGYYVGVTKSSGTYIVSASVTKAGMQVTKYLTDDEQSSSDQGTMGTRGKLNYRKWIVDKIETDHATNYFGIKPSIEVGGKFYHPFYAAFPFKVASAGMHVYYIDEVESKYAVLKEIEGEVPASTPVLIECSSANPSENRVELLATSSAKVTGNLLGGNYFCNGKRPQESVDAYKVFDADKMRVFSVVDGQLVLTNNAQNRLNEIKTVDYSTLSMIKLKCLPSNTSYMKADSDTPAEVPVFVDGQVPDAIGSILAEQKPTAAGVYSLSGTQLRASSDLQGLPAGLYIVNGKKVVIK